VKRGYLGLVMLYEDKKEVLPVYRTSARSNMTSAARSSGSRRNEKEDWIYDGAWGGRPGSMRQAYQTVHSSTISPQLT